MARATKKEQADAIEHLREYLKPGDTVYTVLRHVSSSGMSRAIDLYVIRTNEPQRITYWVGKALDYAYSDRYEALRVDGAGMDMGFHLVYSLGRVLFPDGFTLPEGERGRNGDTSGIDRDGGYALSHRWI